MNRWLERLRTTFLNLSDRERILVGLVVVAAVAAFMTAVALRLARTGERLDERVALAEQQLGAMERLRRQFDDVSQRLASVEERIASGSHGNLRTTLETLANQASVKVESMEPQPSPASERYRETKVEVGLRGVTLPQTVGYLHQIESTPQVLSVKALRIRTRPDKPELLDVTFTVSSFEPL
jgi:Tfp pilus assembly protein PilO